MIGRHRHRLPHHQKTLVPTKSQRYISTAKDAATFMARISKTELTRVKDEFFDRGETIADWAHQRGFSTSAVYQVLSGRCQATRGDSHRIAVALGLKAKPPAPTERAAAAPQWEATM